MVRLASWDRHTEVQPKFCALLFVNSPGLNSILGDGEKRKIHQLYVRQIAIVDDYQKLMLEWLYCDKGAVASEDLPLDFSKEILQQDNILSVFEKNSRSA